MDKIERLEELVKLGDKRAWVDLKREYERRGEYGRIFSRIVDNREKRRYLKELISEDRVEIRWIIHREELVYSEDDLKLPTMVRNHLGEGVGISEMILGGWQFKVEEFNWMNSFYLLLENLIGKMYSEILVIKVRQAISTFKSHRRHVSIGEDSWLMSEDARLVRTINFLLTTLSEDALYWADEVVDDFICRNITGILSDDEILDLLLKIYFPSEDVEEIWRKKEWI